jgi:hypothetical protein
VLRDIAVWVRHARASRPGDAERANVRPVNSSEDGPVRGRHQFIGVFARSAHAAKCTRAAMSPRAEHVGESSPGLSDPGCDWLLILGPRQLDRVLRVFVGHYNSERPRRAGPMSANADCRRPLPSRRRGSQAKGSTRRSREYYRAAA